MRYFKVSNPEIIVYAIEAPAANAADTTAAAFKCWLHCFGFSVHIGRTVYIISGEHSVTWANYGDIVLLNGKVSSSNTITYTLHVIEKSEFERLYRLA